MNQQMSLSVVTFSIASLVRTIGDVLLEELLKNVATIAHQGTQ
jgi:hypothetical protein